MGNFAQVALMAASMIQSQQQAKTQQAAATARQRADIQQRQYQLQIQEREKRDRLKKTLASQRARFGAQGLGSSSGSAAALLNGLRKDTEKSIADARNLNNMQTSNLLNQPASNNRINLLEHRQSQLGNMRGMINLLERN